MNQFAMVMACFMLLAPLFTSAAKASSNENHPSVIAALNCINQIAPIVINRTKTGADVSCDIPVSLSENDLDEIFKAALRSAKMNEKLRGTAEKYSSTFAKTLTNFRAADCTVKLRVKRTTVIEALTTDNLKLQLDDQPTVCDVTTKKHKTQKLKFVFAPRIDMNQGCVSDFALNMGKIDAGCKVCFLNRLYLSTKLVGLWANHMSGNAKRALNAQLGNQCRN